MIAGVPWWMLVVLGWSAVLILTLLFIIAAALLEAREVAAAERDIRELRARADVYEFDSAHRIGARR